MEWGSWSGVSWAAMTASMERKVKRQWGPFLRSGEPRRYSLPRRGSRSADSPEGSLGGEAGVAMVWWKSGVGCVVVSGNFFELLACKAARFRTWVFDSWEVELVLVEGSVWCL